MIYAILFLVASTGHPTNNPVNMWHSPAEVAHVCGVSFWSGEMGLVYMAINLVNGKRYVGQSMISMKKRRYEHECSARRGVHRPFYCALRKYGFDNFEWRVLFDDMWDEDLYPVEQVCIRLLKTRSPHGYNLTDAGPGNIGLKITEETRRKLSESHKGKSNGPLSEEHKRRIGEANRGRVPSAKTRRQASESVKRLWADPEYRAKQVAKRKGKKASVETCWKMSQSQKIAQNRPERLEQLRLAMLGNQRAVGSKTWETRRKLYGANGISNGEKACSNESD